MQSVCDLPGLPGGIWQIETSSSPQGKSAHSAGIVVVVVIGAAVVVDVLALVVVVVGGLVVVVVGTSIVVAGANFWVRLLLASATRTFPLPSTATPWGLSNCPFPVPALPHVVTNVPLLSNFWMRSLIWSATKTF